MTIPENDTQATKAQPCRATQHPYSTQYNGAQCFNEHEGRPAQFTPINHEVKTRNIAEVFSKLMEG